MLISIFVENIVEINVLPNQNSKGISNPVFCQFKPMNLIWFCGSLMVLFSDIYLIIHTPIINVTQIRKNNNLFILPSADLQLTGTNDMLTATASSVSVNNESLNETSSVGETAQIIEEVEQTLDKNDLINEARIKGYEGVSCDECANFTMVRNGTCLKCDTCGATSGCS